MMMATSLKLPALLTAASVLLLVGVAVLERTPKVSLIYADPAYISWLGGLEGDNHEFSGDITPSKIDVMDLGFYRPEVRCNRAPCKAYGDIENIPPEPATFEQYMDLRQAQMAKEREEKEAAVEPVYDGPVGAIDDHPFDLPTYPGMQAEVSAMFDAPVQCPPCSGQPGRRLLSGGCSCH